MKKYCFQNGKIVPLSEAFISPDDVGFLRGYGVFEVLRTYNSKPFLVDWHLDRFESSAEMLDIEKIPSRQEINNHLEELTELFSGNEVSLRIIATGGRTQDSFTPNREEPTFLIIAEEFVDLDSRVYQEGVTLYSVEYKRSLPEAKTLNYILPIKIKTEKEKEGFFDILYRSDGLVLESSTSSFFIVKDGKIITADKDILKGITRRFLIKIADLPVEERPVRFEEITSADEAFLTATNKEIVPVVGVDEIKIGDGKVGVITQRLMKLFKDKAEEYAN